MRSKGLVVAVLGLLAGSLVASPAAAVLPTVLPCGLEAAADLQDDAGSGLDAPDCRDAALVLPKDGYYWGFVGPVDAAEGADPADWFAADMATIFGQGNYVTYGVAVAMTYYTNNAVNVLHQPFALDVWPPGLPAPYTLYSCGGTLHDVAHAGRTHLRLRVATPLEAGPCVAGQYLPGNAGAAPQGATYGFYFGCDPVCTAAA